jgi:hypothetical protein
MKLFDKLNRAIGIKNKYAVREIKEDGRLKAAALLSNEERQTLSRKERMERFRQWQKEQGL